MHLCNADIDGSAIAYGVGCLHNRGNPARCLGKLIPRNGAVFMRFLNPLPVHSPCQRPKVQRFQMITLASTPGPALSAAHSTADITSRMWCLALCLLVAAALTGLAAWVDDRMLGYFGVWMKPLKFQLAMALQTATLAWALAQLDNDLRQRAMPRGVWLLWLAAVLFEAGYITLQGGRGVPSHFNRLTLLESALGTAMAAGASVLVLVTSWIGIWALVQARRTRWPPLMLAIGLGFVLGGVLAGVSGGAMGPRGYWPQPLTEPVQWMPVTGWVLSQTDLRIAHFVGLHQMQWLPAVALVAAAFGLRADLTRGVLIALAAIAPVLVTALM